MLILDIPSDTIVMPVIFSVNVGLAGGEEVLGLDSSKKKKENFPDPAAAGITDRGSFLTSGHAA